MDETTGDTATSRRPLETRSAGWASALARLLLKTPVTPNQISLIGVGFAALGAWAMASAAANPWLWLAGAFGIQLRLLANMLDGMVAVEGGRGSPTGPLFNELPDRLQDTLLLVSAGYGAGMGWIGWLAAVLAVSCAYVRAQGAALGCGQDFRGPMAKPHRMAALTLGALLSLGAALAGMGTEATLYSPMAWTLGLIALGTAFTIARRTGRIAHLLRKGAGA